MTRPRAQGFHDFISTNTNYAATNGYPETARDAVPLLVAILDKTPRLDGAICATHPNPDLWFPDGHDRKAVAEAQSLCATCPVITECRDYADTTRQDHGVWAGRCIGAGQKQSLTHCREGHEWNDDTIRWRKTKAGRDYRECRACTRERQRTPRKAIA